MEGKPNW